MPNPDEEDAKVNVKAGSFKRALLSTLIIASLMVILLLAPLKAAGFSGSGSGTAEDPCIITTVEQLQAIENNLTAHYALGNDIDASATKTWNSNGSGGYYGFEPIGTYENRFTGSFDGRGYKIYDLYINRFDSHIGLFGYVGSGGVVENVGMENEDVSGDMYVGGLVGLSEGGAVSNCYSTGSVSGTYVGGLVGLIYSAVVSNCYFTGSVNGSSAVGGLVGCNWYGTVSNCYSTGSVSGSGIYVGGLVGSNDGNISNSYSTGSVNGNDAVGGLVGRNDGNISNSYSTGSVNGSGDYGGYVGGLVGGNNGTVSNSFWDTQTSGQSTSSGGTGKTTAQMKTKATFTNAGWDFVTIWGIDPATNDGYPFLAVAAPSGEGTTAPSGERNWPLIAGVVGVIVVIGIVATVYIRRR
jgi:hypothetical protein